MKKESCFWETQVEILTVDFLPCQLHPQLKQLQEGSKTFYFSVLFLIYIELNAFIFSRLIKFWSYYLLAAWY